MTLIRNIGTYSVFNVLNKATPFLILPILTNYLPPEEYAFIDIFQAIFLFLIPLIGLNINSATNVYYFQVNNKQRESLFTNAIIISGCCGAIFLILFSPLDNYLTNFFFGAEGANNILTLAVIYTCFNQIILILLDYFRLNFKAINYGIIVLLRTVIEIGFSLILIIIFKFNWEGRIYPQVLVGGIFALLALFFFYNKDYLRQNKFDYKLAKDSIFYSSPLIGHLLAVAVIGYSDRIFITQIVGIKELGQYAVAYQFGLILSVLSNSINQAWSPHLFKKLSEKPCNPKINYRECLIISLTITVFGIIVIILSPVVYNLFISDLYRFDLQLMIVLILSYVINGAYRIFVNFLFFYKKTILITGITIAAALINIMLNYFFIIEFGVIGAAYATLIAFLLQLLFVFFYVRKTISALEVR